jgi:hypothetical protein
MSTFITSKYNNPEFINSLGNRNDAKPTQRNHTRQLSLEKKETEYLNMLANSTTERNNRYPQIINKIPSDIWLTSLTLDSPPPRRYGAQSWGAETLEEMEPHCEL